MHGCVQLVAGGVLGLAFLAPASAGAPTPFVDGATIDIAPGTWDGRFEFAGVYCLTFPAPAHATRLRSALFNDAGISLVRVDYGPVHMSVVSSTMPMSLTDEREHLDQLARSADASAALPAGLYIVTTEDSPMGPVVRRRLSNVASSGPEHLGQPPFPIHLAFYDQPADQIATVAELRLFSRWPDRYEVAVHAPGPGRDSPAGIDQARLLATTFADELLRSLQACTSALPPRTPDP